QILASEENAGAALSELRLFSEEQLRRDLHVQGEVEAIHPLTASQQGFYLNDLIREDNQSTLIGTSILVKGGFDLERWREALQALSDQRSILRMQIYPGQDKLHEAAYQVFFKSLAIDFEQIDARDWSFDETQRKAKEIIYTPFTLHKSPLIRYRVFCLPDQQYLLVTSMHHCLMDAVSALQHWVEAQALYEGKTVAPDNYFDYLDFASRQIDNDEVLLHWR